MGLGLKTILITGTSQGIGRELSLCFLSNGYKVIGISRKKSDIVNEQYQHMNIDLDSDSDLESLRERLKDISIEIFIHGAMYTPKHRPFLRVSLSDMRKSYNVCTVASLEIIKSIYSHMKNKNGRIIFLSSGITETGSKGQIPYLCAKSSLSGLMKGLSLELEKVQITVNALLLGPVETQKLKENLTEKQIKPILDNTPDGNYLTVNKIINKIDEIIKDQSISGKLIPLGYKEEM